MEEIFEALKRVECIKLRHSGTIHVRPERDGLVFKFNPSQQLCKLLGWSLTYKGEL